MFSLFHCEGMVKRWSRTDVSMDSRQFGVEVMQPHTTWARVKNMSLPCGIRQSQMKCAMSRKGFSYLVKVIRGAVGENVPVSVIVQLVHEFQVSVADFVRVIVMNRAVLTRGTCNVYDDDGRQLRDSASHQKEETAAWLVRRDSYQPKSLGCSAAKSAT